MSTSRGEYPRAHRSSLGKRRETMGETNEDKGTLDLVAVERNKDVEFIQSILTKRGRGDKVVGADLDKYRRLVLSGAPEPGSVWRHYRGTLYLVLATALDEATLEPVVCYRQQVSFKATADEAVWTRKLASWNDPVPDPPDAEGGPARRFELVHGPGGPTRAPARAESYPRPGAIGGPVIVRDEDGEAD
jgi:hypothetical protein